MFGESYFHGRLVNPVPGNQKSGDKWGARAHSAWLWVTSGAEQVGGVDLICSCSLVQSSSLIETMIDKGYYPPLQPQHEEVKAEKRT